jgi:hypothetical protein
MAKAKDEKAMKNNLQFTRIFADRGAIHTIQKLADAEGRSMQRQIGILLERIAEVSKTDPDSLVKLGFISPFVAKQHVA